MINQPEDAVWYVVATITSVGYGDIVPVTYWGRMVGLVFLLHILVFMVLSSVRLQIYEHTKEQKNSA